MDLIAEYDFPLKHAFFAEKDRAYMLLVKEDRRNAGLIQEGKSNVGSPIIIDGVPEVEVGIQVRPADLDSFGVGVHFAAV